MLLIKIYIFYFNPYNIIFMNTMYILMIFECLDYDAASVGDVSVDLPAGWSQCGWHR